MLTFTLLMQLTTAQLAVPDTPQRWTALPVAEQVEDRVYFSRGSRAGLSKGTQVSLSQQGRAVGGCVIDRLSPHHASCVTLGLHVDGAQFSAPAHPAPNPPPPALRAPPIDAARARFRRAVSARSFERVIAQVPQRDVHHTPLRARLASQTDALTSPFRSILVRPFTRIFQRESLSVSAPHFQLGDSGAVATIRARVVGTSIQADRVRFDEGQRAHLQIFEANAQYRPQDLPVVIAAGRMRPRAVAGLRVLDGGLLGTRLRLGPVQVEAGGYAGTLPEPVSLLPRTDVVLAGAYSSAQAHGFGLTFLQQTRVGAVTDLSGGWRPDVDALLQVGRGQRWQLAAGARAALDLRTGARPFVEQMWVQTSARPFQQMRVSAGYRFFTVPGLDDGAPYQDQAGTGRHNLSAQLAYLALPKLELRSSGAATVDQRTGAKRLVTTVGFRAPFSRLSWTADWEESFGFGAGRMLSTGLQGHPSPTSRYWVRAMLFETAAPEPAFPLLDATREVAVDGRASFALWSRIQLQAGLRAGFGFGFPLPVGKRQGLAIGLTGDFALVITL